MKNIVVILLLLLSLASYGQQFLPIDSTKIISITDSILLHTFGDCVFEQNLSFDSIQIEEGYKEYNTRLPEWPYLYTVNSHYINYFVHYSFELDGQKINKLTLYLNANGELQRGGVIDFSAKHHEEIESCNLMDMEAFSALELEIFALHKLGFRNYDIAVYEHQLAIRCASFLTAEDLLITHHSLHTGELIHKGFERFMP